MSLVAIPPPPQSPPGSHVSAGDWWPQVDCQAVRAALRLGDVVTHDRLVAAIEGALITVTGELREWKAQQTAAGHAALADVEDDEQINGATRMEALFQRAVRFCAGAELLEGHRDAAATNELLNRADAEIQTAADYRRLATHAIRDMIGTTRTTVELI